MERSELVLSGILILAVATGAFWNAHRIHSSQLHPVVVEASLLPQVGGVRPDVSTVPFTHIDHPGGSLPGPGHLGKRDVNHATAIELAEASGIGPVLSDEIVSFREQHGPFRRMEDLLEVPGIGPARLKGLRELFDVCPGEALAEGGESRVLAPGSVYAPGGEAGEQRDARFDINVASASELMNVPGIGPVLAERIVRFREENGPFQAIEDLTLVSGIGAKRLESFTPYLRLEADAVRFLRPGSTLQFESSRSGTEWPTVWNAPDLGEIPAGGSTGTFPSARIDLNRASKEELMSLPGIGSVIAERIIEDRRTRGPFQTPADIQRVSGIGPKRFEAMQHLVEAGP